MKLNIPSFKLYVSIEKFILIVLSKIEINLLSRKSGHPKNFLAAKGAALESTISGECSHQSF